MRKQQPAVGPDATKIRQIIHIARSQLAMDDETYRTILVSRGGATSTLDMDMPALRRVLDHMKLSGFKVRPRRGGGRSVRADEPMARKVRALWLFLHALGVVKDPSEAALAAYVKRVAKVDDLHWVPEHKFEALIESLKNWAMRGGLQEKVRLLVFDVADKVDWTQEVKHQSRIRKAVPGAGFDAYYRAWVSCMELLERDIHPEIAPLRRSVS